MTIAQGPHDVACSPRRPIWARIWSRIAPPPRRPEDRKAPAYLVVQRQLIYGWFDNPAMTGEPAQDPPLDGPCLYCGKPIVAGDVVFNPLRWSGTVEGRSYFYRTHHTCTQMEPGSAWEMDTLVWQMIARNGD